LEQLRLEFENKDIKNNMKKINLFLTSSLQGLEKDITELGAFVSDLNDRYAPRAYFSLHVSGEGEMEEDIKAAENSELFYIIFHDDPQDRAKAEFEAAYAAFREKKAPKIITYYKQLDSDQPGQSALAFMDKLRNELGHFNSKYTHMDTIKLNVVLQLKSLGLEHVKVDVEGSALVLDGKELMTLDNIPVIFNNKNLVAKKKEYAGVEKEFWELRERVRKNPDDEETLAAYLHISGKKNKIGEFMHSLQKDILTMETSFLEKAGSGYISPRQRQAKLCFDQLSKFHAVLEMSIIAKAGKMDFTDFHGFLLLFWLVDFFLGSDNCCDGIFHAFPVASQHCDGTFHAFPVASRSCDSTFHAFPVASRSCDMVNSLCLNPDTPDERICPIADIVA
jgi:hypothetical protein